MATKDVKDWIANMIKLGVYFGRQTVYTPDEIFNEYFNIILYIKKYIKDTKKENVEIALTNVETLQNFFEAEMVDEHYHYTFLYDAEIKKTYVQFLVNKYNYKYNITMIDISGIDYLNLNEELRKKLNMKHFDFVISNPPYSIGHDGGTFEEKNADLVFLEEVLKYSDRVSFVMTARFMIREDMKQKRIDLSKYCESIVLFDGKKDFEIQSYWPLCIINLNKNKTTEKIKIIDNYYTNTEYELNNLDHFNKYGFNEDEIKEYNKLINNLTNHDPKDPAYYLGHCIGWKEFNAPLGFYLGSAAGDVKRNIKDIVTVDDNAGHVFTDKNIIVAKVKSQKYLEADDNKYFIVPIKTKEDGINISKSYKEEIIRFIIDVRKSKQRIYKCTAETLPWPVDENGNIKYFTNEDWIKKLNIPQNIANKVISYYNNHPELAIKK